MASLTLKGVERTFKTDVKCFSKSLSTKSKALHCSDTGKLAVKFGNFSDELAEFAGFPAYV